MSTICLSLAPVLRCIGLTRTFTGTLAIPPGLAFLVSLTLLFVRRNGDKKRLLLVGEGLIYFILALLDFISKIVLTKKLSVSTFKALDITVGVLTDVPVFLYCVFLVLFVRSVLIKGLPQNMQRICYFVFIFAIPAILIVNACASFIGISYASVTITEGEKPTIGINFKSNHAMDVWQFLNDWALALLGFVQFIVFVLAFARIARPPRTQGSKSSTGLMLVAFGLLIGAIDCMVGYAANTTTVVFVRRSFHALARALIVAGLLAGIDEATSDAASEKSSLRSRIGSPDPSSFTRLGGEGESILEKPMEPVQVDPTVQLARVKTVIRDMKNAAFNPFDPRTPPATQSDMPIPPPPMSASDLKDKGLVDEKQNPFADTPTIVVVSEAKSPSIADMSIVQRSGEKRPEPYDSDDDNTPLPSPVPAARPRPQNPEATDRTAQRVTLHYDSASGRAPHLEMRLSGIDLPSPSAIIASLRKFDALRPNSDPITGASAVSPKSRLPRTNTMAGSLAQLRKQYANDTEKSGENLWYPFRGSPTKALARSLTAVHTRNKSSLSTFSSAADIEAGDPENDPKPADPKRHSRAQTVDGSSTKRPRSRGHFSVMSGGSTMSDASDWVKDLAPRFPDIPPVPVPSRVVSTFGPFSGSTTPMRAATPEPGVFLRSPFADPSDETEEDAAHAIRGVRDLPPLDTGVGRPPMTSSPTSARTYDSDNTSSAASTRRMGALDVPMSALDAPELVEVPGTARPSLPLPTPSPSSFTSSPGGISRAGKPADLVSIKSVGSAPRRSTPVATPATAGRSSVPIEHFVFDIRANPTPVSGTGSERVSALSAYTAISPVSSTDVRPGFAQ